MKLVPLDYTQEEMASTNGVTTTFKMPETEEDIRKYPIPWSLVGLISFYTSVLPLEFVFFSRHPSSHQLTLDF